MAKLLWKDLTDAEQKQVTESYLSIRECEENRERDDTQSNPDYPNPINPDYVKSCTFTREFDGYITVNI